MHALFVAVTFTTLTGFLLLVHFDHDYLPDMGDVSGWTDRSRVHGVGVVILITGFFALHMLVLHAYVMRVKSYHDFRDLCGGLGGGGREWPALGKGGAAEAHLLPVLRRGVYVGTISVYLMVFVVFAFFFIFEVRALCSPPCFPVRPGLHVRADSTARAGRARRPRRVLAIVRFRRRLPRKPHARPPHLARVRRGMSHRQSHRHRPTAPNAALARAR